MVCNMINLLNEICGIGNRGKTVIGLVYQIRKEFFQILAGIVDFVHINIRLNEGFDNDFNIVSLAEDMDFSVLIDDL